MRLLLLEDDAMVADAVLSTVASFGYEGVHANTFDEAVAAFQMYRSFDVALVDFGLSQGKSGVQFLRWIQEHHPTTRRVLTSGHTLPEELTIRGPAQAFLRKPYSHKELEDALSPSGV